MLSGLHILLTYACTYECDHCFLYCKPSANGVFTFAQMKNLFEQARELGSIKAICFEGGEPFLYYPLLLQAVKLARNMGFRVTMVTNGYWATSEDDAEFWLGPLKELQIADLSISDDTFHSPEGEESPAQRGLRAATKLGLPVGSICIEPPMPQCPESGQSGKGQPVLGGNVRFRGRAVDTMAADLPTRLWEEFCECPYEELVSPERVHVDPFGYLHVCQGLTIGNIWQTPLRDVIGNYDAQSHPICGPLVRGGPAGLATELGLDHADEYVDACHFCYMMRRALIDRYPECLAPRQVYGLQPPGTDTK